MNDDILKAIESNTEKIRHDVQTEIFARPEARYYLAASDEAVSNRISQVIRDVNKGLRNWLGKKEPEDLLFDRYLHLGATRCRQCMPLEEVAAVLQMIRRQICTVIGTQTAADHTCARDEPADIISYVNLLFTGITQAVTTGYQDELASISIKPGQEHLLPKKAFRI